MKKTIELTIEHAKELYGKDKSIDLIIEANFTKEELANASKWEDLKSISGFYITSSSEISEYRSVDTTKPYKNVFATKAQAKSALAFAQLTQLMQVANGKWKPDYKNNQSGVGINYSNYSNSIQVFVHDSQHNFLVFKDVPTARMFIDAHHKLLVDFFMIK